MSRDIDILRSLYQVDWTHFKRKWSQKVDLATFCTACKSASMFLRHETRTHCALIFLVYGSVRSLQCTSIVDVFECTRLNVPDLCHIFNIIRHVEFTLTYNYTAWSREQTYSESLWTTFMHEKIFAFKCARTRSSYKRFLIQSVRTRRRFYTIWFIAARVIRVRQHKSGTETFLFLMYPKTFRLCDVSNVFCSSVNEASKGC
jgi:hypothetical protein